MSSGEAVAKCSATSGEYVQSSRRVGKPRCCPSASQSQVLRACSPSLCAYFLKFLSSASSTRPTSAEPASRTSELVSGRVPRDNPRNAYGDRKRCKPAFHDPAYSDSRISVQPDRVLRLATTART